MSKPLIRYNARDIFVMALTLYGEARGLSEEGQVKVAWVIRNRAERVAFVGPRMVGSEGAVAHACMMPWQFSCWNESDPNREQLVEWLGTFDRYFYDDNYEGEKPPAPTALKKQLALASAVLEGIVEDITNGADHYHTTAKPRWAREWPPHWAPHMRVVSQDAGTKGHVFYDSRHKALTAKSA